MKIYYIVRSIDEAELEEISNKSKVLNNNFQSSEIYRDAIWEVNEKSELFNKYKNLYFNEFNKYPKEKIGHKVFNFNTLKVQKN